MTTEFCGRVDCDRRILDPTRNVTELVGAAISRQDDLRVQESVHIREIMAVREEFEDKLRVAETERINAIRAVDVGAVNRAAEVSAAQALTLAGQVSTSADALRAQVEATRITTSQALAAALEPIQKDITELRKVQYEQAGAKASGQEQKANTSDARIWLLGIVGTLIAAVVLIAPHIK